jgi:hypothetical protein
MTLVFGKGGTRTAWLGNGLAPLLSVGLFLVTGCSKTSSAQPGGSPHPTVTAVASASASADAATPTPSRPHSLVVRVHLNQDLVVKEESNDPNNVVPYRPECAGTDGFQDMRRGAQVIVKDANGSILAVGALTHTRWTDVKSDNFMPGSIMTTGKCLLTSAPISVKDGAFYQLQIAARAPVVYSRSQLLKLHWVVDLSLA